MGIKNSKTCFDGIKLLNIMNRKSPEISHNCENISKCWSPYKHGL